MNKLRTLDLFAGIGGFSLGLHRTGGFETVAFVERDDYASKVLAKNFKGVPIYDDVRTFDADGLGRIDCVTGGYPCQPFSLAGKRLGKEDDRHLWPEMLRIVASTRPRWVIAENVAGHINMGLDQVLSDLEDEGYTSQPIVIPACAVDAPHRRDRVWIVANNDCQHRSADEGEPNTGADRRDELGGVCEDVPNTDGGIRRRGEIGRKSGNGQPALHGEDGALAYSYSYRIQGREVEGSNAKDRAQSRDKQLAGLRGINRRGNTGQAEWLPEPNVGRVAHGIPKRVDRLKCLGNAIVPQLATVIGMAILEAESPEKAEKTG